MGLHTGLISGLIVTGTDMPSLLLPGLLIKSNLGSRAWIWIEGRIVRDSDPHSQLGQISNHRDMDSQYATVDQLAEITDTMASLRDAILGLGQRIDGHQAQPLPISGSTPHDSTTPPPSQPPSSGPTVQQDYTVPPPPPPTIIWTHCTTGLYSSTPTTTTSSISPTGWSFCSTWSDWDHATFCCDPRTDY